MERLSVEVGVLAALSTTDAEAAAWFREDVRQVNRALVARGLPAHVEPEALPELGRRGLDDFPYEYLHRLRRAQACLRAGRPLRAGPLTPADERLLRRTHEEVGSGSHLCCHGDAEGFYVPIDFPQVLVDAELPAEMLGSSQRLLAELLLLAPSLAIELERRTGRPREEALDEIEEAGAGEGEPLGPERAMWLGLHAAAELSIRHGALIVFC